VVIEAWTEALADRPLEPGVEGALAAELLAGLAATEPVVVVVEADGAAARAFVARARDLAASALILAIREADRSDADRVIRLGWLSPDERIELLTGLLPLDAGDARLLAERVGGLPGALVSAVRGLARTDGFAVDGVRLSLRAGAVDALDRPRDPGPWVASLDPAARAALEVAAWLGADVSTQSWRRACEAAGARIPPDLVDRGLRAGWLAETPDGFAFVSAQARAALGPPRPDRPVRRPRARGGAGPRHGGGELLLALGQTDEALQALAQGARFARNRLGPSEALPRYAQLETLAAANGRLREAAFIGTWRAWVLHEMGQVDASRALSEELAERGRAAGWPDVEAGALHTLATMSPRERTDLVTRAIRLYREGGRESFARQLELQRLRGADGYAELVQGLTDGFASAELQLTALVCACKLAGVDGPPGEVRRLLDRYGGTPMWIAMRLVIEPALANGDLDLAEELAAKLLDAMVDHRSAPAAEARLFAAGARLLRGEPADDEVAGVIRACELEEPLLALAWVLLATSASLRGDRRVFDERWPTEVDRRWRIDRQALGVRLGATAAQAWARAGDDERRRAASAWVDRLREFE
jgi:hypothetical protein